MTDDRKLADQIMRMRRFVASQEATIQAKVEELAEALGRSIEDTEALLRATASPADADKSLIRQALADLDQEAPKSDTSGFHPTRTPRERAISALPHSQRP